MLFGGGSKNTKIKAVFFILFFLWILMAQGKQGADSLGLWRKAGWNWPLCRPQAIGLCTTFSGLIHSCKFNFHPLKADRGCRDNRAQLPLPGRAAQPAPLCSPWKCLYNAELSGWHWKCFEIPLALGQMAVPWPLLSSFWEENMDNTKPGICSAWEGVSHLQSLVLVEPPWRYGLEKLLQPKRLCHSLESKRIWFLRVCSNKLKASAHYFSCFPEFQRNFKTLPASWGFYLEC